MGRPLFSKSYSTDALPVEPQAVNPTYEKWTEWNRFDPDAEEFFEGAIYEAFVDPADLARPGSSVDESESDSDSSRPSSPPVVVTDADRAESSATFSSESASGEDDEMEIDGVAGQIARDDATAIEEPVVRTGRRVSVVERRVPVQHFAPRAFDEDVVVEYSEEATADPVFARGQQARAFTPSSQFSSATRIPVHVSDGTMTPGPSDNLEAGRSDVAVPSLRPSTPPPSRTPLPQTPDAPTLPQAMTPSPASATPSRLYSWRPVQASPTPALNNAGPLTNPGARMSFSRLDLAPGRTAAQAQELVI